VVLRLLDRVTQALNLLGSALVFGLMLLIGADVTGRALLGAPLAGVPELVALSIVAIVFLQGPAALQAGRFTRAEVVIAPLARRAPRLALMLETLFDLAGAAVVAVIVATTWPMLADAWVRGHFVGAIGNFTAPVWPVKAVIVAGGGVLVLQFLARAARRFSGSQP
jgi:TRAP-type mannitol/chloroaromatic compound transport system permease small subunit